MRIAYPGKATRFVRTLPYLAAWYSTTVRERAVVVDWSMGELWCIPRYFGLCIWLRSSVRRACPFQ